MELDSPDQVTRHEDALLRVSFWYPRIDGHVNTIEVDLVDVRAADSIRVTFDFDRNGWLISQPVFSDDEEAEPEWQETAFLDALGKEQT